ncbi:MAG: FHA domain-containing protein [Dehalococcoidia bacterium]|nr:FHA domain-containing protein [Dehalococcoidia bacterium]
MTMSGILEIHSGDDVREHGLAQVTTIGRAEDNDVLLSHPAVSRHHARLEWVSDILRITDLGSTNGTQVGGVKIEPNVPHALKDSDVIRIGIFTLKLRLHHVVSGQGVPKTQKLALHGQESLTIGRDPGNDVVLSHPIVSRKHARITRTGPDGEYAIEDLGSTNGTFVNGKRVAEPRPLHRGDSIHVGPIKLIFEAEKLTAIDESHDLRLDALHLSKFVSKDKNLLKDISLSVQPREFVAIVGVTSAGKSTLLDALNGFRPATSGKVLVNGNDLYSNFDVYRTQLGYVPQKNIIHMELTAYEALDYSARLRLPADTTPAERHQRVMDVLEKLELTERKDGIIRDLSGGEQKRVSIGVELLTQPGLFFLDEATSGLDPVTERQIMRLLRKLSDEGHTILIVTHTTKNVMQCDQVAFLARGGHLAYYGPPQEALTYFGVKDFDEIYDKLQRERSPEEWAQLYQQSEQYRKLVAARARDYLIKPSAVTSRGIIYQQPGATLKRISALRQFAILSRRNLNVLIRDKVSLILMLLMAPLIGALDFVFWKPGVFASNGGAPTKAVINLFLAAVICFLVGALASMREIVKETDIYRRERMVTLKIMPYVVSKVWMALLVALYSAGVFALFMKLAGAWPPPESILPVYVTLTLAIMAGALTGLLISALSPNQNVTPLLLLLFLVPQIIFGGIMPAGQMGKVGQVISRTMTTSWAFESLVTISGMGKCVAEDPCWQLPKDEREALTEEDKICQCSCLGPNLFSRCSFPGILDFYDPAVNDPEPAQPLKPGDPPAKPSEPPPQPSERPENVFTQEFQDWEKSTKQYQKDMDAYQETIEQYRKDMEAYQDRVERYEDNLKTWQGEYRNWKESRSKAIGQAEAIIKRMYEDYGHAFNVNVARHWTVLMVIMAILFGLILAAMRLQDRR